MAVRGGRYELIRAIASGGMATVHLGRAVGMGGFERFVAIKVMHAHLAEEPEFVAMFLDEARLAARIRHPNVVGTIDIQQDEEGLFLVMEYVEGPSLQRILRARAKRGGGPLPLDVTLRIFLDALAGLHAAHELRGRDGEPLNPVHRDVSPQNILISVDGGIAQITDFGVARAESRLQTTRAGVVKGKVCYMAPEQIRSEPIDRRTDVHAAGVLLWELLTGQRLIRGDSDAAMMEKILAGRHPTPREATTSSDADPRVQPVPEAISAACMRAIAGAPADRFPTAAAFADALEAAARSEGVTIASPRVLTAFVNDLGLERGDTSATGPTSGTSKSLDAPPRSGERAVSGATAAPSAGHAPDSTHAAFLATSGAGKPRRPGALLWAGAAVFVLFAGGGWLLLRRNSPPTPASREPGPPAASAAPAPVQPPPPAPEPQAAAPSATATASPDAGAPVAATATATATPAKPPAAAVKPRPAASPTSFRPRDL